jgi:hypothetical protein
MRCLWLALLVVAFPAMAQNYSGTYTTRNPGGNTVTLTLTQDKQGKVTGSLSGNGASFQVQGQAQPEGMMGTVTGEAGKLYIMAQLDGANLRVVLAEPGPGGQPNLQGAQQLLMTRSTQGASSNRGQSPKP